MEESNHELRCDGKLHGIIVNDRLEVKCDSRWCGKRPGIIVLHRFNLETGKVTTQRYKDPGKGTQDGIT